MDTVKTACRFGPKIIEHFGAFEMYGHWFVITGALWNKQCYTITHWRTGTNAYVIHETTPEAAAWAGMILLAWNGKQRVAAAIKKALKTTGTLNKGRPA